MKLRRLLGLAVLAVGCGSESNSVLPSTPEPLRFSPKASVHEGELARDVSLRADLSRQRLISYLETRPTSLDTATVGTDRLPFYCAQAIRFRLSTDAPHLAEARILNQQGELMARWGQGSRELALAAGEYRLELDSNRSGDTHIFWRSRPPATISPLATGFEPGVFVAELSESPTCPVIGVQSALVGVSSDGSSYSTVVNNVAELSATSIRPGPNLLLGVQQYFQNGGNSLCVTTCASTSAADLNEALGQLELTEVSYQLALADLYQIPVDQADPLIQAAISWTAQHNSLLIVDVPGSVNTSAGAVSWRLQRPELSSNSALLYWPGLALAGGPSLGSSSSVLGLLDQLALQSGPGAAPQGAKLQGVQGPAVAYDVAEISDLGAAQINPVYPDLTLVAGQLLQAEPAIPDLSARQKLLTIEQSVKLYMNDFVFSPNTEATWQLLVQAVSATLQQLYLQGVLAGGSSSQAYSVQCGLGLTMTGEDILNGYLILSGVVLLEVGLPSVQLNFTQIMQTS